MTALRRAVATPEQVVNARHQIARMQWAKDLLAGEPCVNARHAAAVQMAEDVRRLAARYGEDVTALDRAVAAFEGGSDARA